LQAKEGGDPFLPLFAEQRGVGVSSYDYMIDIQSFKTVYY
jgi:hypothetical protein